MRIAAACLLTWTLSIATAGGQAVETDAPAWLGSGSPGVPFEIMEFRAPMVLPGAALPDPVEIPFAFVRRAALYNRVRVLPGGSVGVDFGGASSTPVVDASEPGIAPAAATPAAPPEEGVLYLRPLDGVTLQAGPASQVIVDGNAERLVVRFLRWTVQATGALVTYEVILHPDGEVRYQYLQIPHELAARVALEKGDGIERVVPSEGGFVPGSGKALRFPNGRLLPRSGCGQDLPWCTRAESTGRRACTTGARGASGCQKPPCTPCSTTSAIQWNFNEAAYCASCPYQFYVVVECGTEMHIPGWDMEGNSVRITDVFTGTVQALDGINECAFPPPVGGFVYCNQCATGAGIWPSQPGTCGTWPEIPCTPYLQTSNLIQWGMPLQGTPPSLPCGPANVDGCPPDQASGTQTRHEQQTTDVILRGNPGLCGVFRLDIISGGYDWSLFANCDGTDTPNYTIYQNCADALAAFNPLPELVITDFYYTGVCPNIVLYITVENIGCVDAPRSPVRIEYGNRTINQDLGYVPVNGAVLGVVPVALTRTPIDVTVSVDPANTLVECKEDAGAVACAKAVGQESITKTVCVCANTVNADTTADKYFACEGGTATLDASASYIEPCTGGVRQYQFRDSQGSVQRSWDPDPTFTFTPGRCPSIENWTVEARCSLETAHECVSSKAVQVECAENPTVTITPSKTLICEGDVVTLDAGPGFATYDWSTGETTRVIQDNPGPPSRDYSVTVVNSKGCSATDSVQVTVIPDGLPGALGATLRAEKLGPDVIFRWKDLAPPPEAGNYQLLAYLPDGGSRPCVAQKPPLNPGPPRMDGVAMLLATVPPGMEEARHFDGVEACPSVIFYKVRAMSKCLSKPGPTCNESCTDPNVCYRGCP